MDEASKVLSASRVTIEAGGVRFEMHRLNAARAAEVFGSGVLRMPEGEDETDGKSVEERLVILARRLDVARKIFEVCAISPKPGDTVTREDGSIVVLTARDFDSFALLVVAQLMENEERDAELFAGGPADATGPN